MRKICIITGSRAEHGLLFWLMKEVQEDADLQLQIVGTGMHLAPEFGKTYHQIEDNGFKVDKNIEILLSWSTKPGIIQQSQQRPSNLKYFRRRRTCRGIAVGDAGLPISQFRLETEKRKRSI